MRNLICSACVVIMMSFTLTEVCSMDKPDPDECPPFEQQAPAYKAVGPSAETLENKANGDSDDLANEDAGLRVWVL
ncbi:hypothetical protein FACS189449_09870 [Alphaproteobacteria bacterium]|nr:hypothetical protein FACS189449_09870 [Alphaproteobacteria bacterium]